MHAENSQEATFPRKVNKQERTIFEIEHATVHVARTTPRQFVMKTFEYEIQGFTEGPPGSLDFYGVLLEARGPWQTSKSIINKLENQWLQLRISRPCVRYTLFLGRRQGALDSGLPWLNAIEVTAARSFCGTNNG